MSVATPHSKLLTQAAREVLRPMGLEQKGRSRTWIDDRGWWLCIVEFQPSSWSKGSYLNVGAMWLWDDEHDFHFDVGHRVRDAPYVEFVSEGQFAPEIRNLANIAAREVNRYRRLFPRLRSAAAFLDARKDGLNPHGDALNAGIAWGTLGEMKEAARSLARAHEIIEHVWAESVQEVAIRSDDVRIRASKKGVHYLDRASLASFRPRANEDHSRVARFEVLLSEPDLFRAEVLAAIASARKGLRLPPLDVEVAR